MTTYNEVTRITAGDDHVRLPLPSVIGGAGVLALSGGLLLLAGVGTVLAWPGASTFGRLCLAAVDVALLVFAGTVALYQVLDLRELHDRQSYNSERRTLLLQRIELAIDADLDGDGVVGPAGKDDKPRFAKLNHGGQTDLLNLGGQAERDMLNRALALVDAIGKAGTLSRRRVLPLLGGDGPDSRWLYDTMLGTGEAPGILPTLGLVQGRSARSAGRLTYGVEDTKSLLRRAWGGDYDKSIMLLPEGRP